MKRKASVHRFQYAGWDIAVELDAAAVEGSFEGHADLSYGGQHKCRIALPGPHSCSDGTSALDVLANEAKAFIDSWRLRVHIGTTGFDDPQSNRERR
ncbi:MAG: hypothetical protein EOP82_20580 [Variovorax sp.]|nr:MAG: hypothetical protein EOP82_20580 [Variovorax sp.]